MFTFEHHKNKVLINEGDQYQLDNEGYVIVPFYTDDDVKQLINFYNETTHGNQSGFRPTTYFHDMDYRILASNKILSIAAPHLEKHLTNYKTYMGSFIVKHADNKSELGVHQDMTLVDESKFMSINIWSPLCDTTPENGALYLIPKSHRIFPTYRNASISNIYDKHYNVVKNYMQAIYLKAGEAIFFDNSLLHFSPANFSNEIRIATNVFITHKDAAITICHLEKETNKIELFEQADDFFTAYRQFENGENMLRPKIGNSLGFMDYNFPVLTPEILKEKYGALQNQSWMQKIKHKIFS